MANGVNFNLNKVFSFLSDLAKNNNKEWMDLHKQDYLIAKKQFEDFGSLLINEFAKHYPALTGMDIKKCMFRINRDVRFSNNKAPYKTNMAAYFNANGKKSQTAGFYIHLQPNESFVGIGMWMPPAEIINAVRQEIDYNTQDFLKIISDKKFKNNFGNLDNTDMLKSAPKGYDKNADNIELLKYKSYLVSKSYSNKEVCNADFLKAVLNDFKLAIPFVNFLNLPFNSTDDE